MPSLSFDRQFDIDRALFLAERAAQFRQRDVLQLANALAGHAEFLADFLEGLRFAAVEAEAREDDLPLAIVEHVEQTADFVAKVLVAQQFERRLRFFVADDLAELGGIVVADRRIERRRTDRHGLELRNFSAGNADLFAELVVGRFAAELLAHLQRDAAHLGDLVDQMDGQTDRLALVGQGALDRLLDPPRGVGAEFSALRGVETLDGLHQTDVALGDEVEQRQAEVRVIVRDLHDQTQDSTES